MASINATTSSGIVATADNTGQLQLQSAGTTIATISSTGLTMNSGNIIQASNAAPAFSAHNNATQSLLNNNEFKVLFQVEEFDTNNNFASSRFTPTVAGYYQINAQIKIENNSNNGTVLCMIWKNGTYYKENQATVRAGSNTGSGCSSIVYLNGTSDFVEVYVLQSTGATATLVTNTSLAVYFNGCFLRSA